MGVSSLIHRIEDFLSLKVPPISDIMTPTKFGPSLIGGNGGKLEAANLHFSRNLNS